MRRDLSALLDIANAIRHVQSFSENMDRAHFDNDLKTQSAVMLQIVGIGEASRRVSMAFRGQHAELPWPQMMGMRNRLVHEYDVVELDLLWSTIREDLPDLLKKIEPLIAVKE